MIKNRFGDIFQPTDDDRIRISDEAPQVLFDAIETAKQNLNEESEYVVRAVGGERRSLDFGIENLTTIQTKSATIFAGDIEEGTKVLAVGVSDEGALNKEQINQAIEKFAKDAKLSPEELAKAEKIKSSVRSISQAKTIVVQNSINLRDKLAEIEVLLSSPKENQNQIERALDDAELNLHNLLSSVYTFTETINQSLRNLDVLSELKHYIQKYRDKNATVIGLRHCIQHNFTLKIVWTAKYSHDTQIFNYRMGVPLHEVKNRELYTKQEVYDAAGESYSPTQYYYRDVDNFIIDIEDMALNIQNSTNETYKNITEDLDNRSIEIIETSEKFFRLGKYRFEGAIEN